MKIFQKIVVVFLLFCSQSYAQNKLTGKVVNSDNKPIANAKLFLDSINSNVKTNRRGEFEILVPEKINIINVYSPEYGLLSSKYNNESVMNFMFLESDKTKKDQASKNDEVSIGYSTIEKKDQVNKVENIDVKSDKNNSFYATIFDMIRGRLSGVSVSRDNKISIRGVSSIRNITDPLFVVDGSIVSSIDFISPANVKNISVLKGSDASIYGSRGANGVILINTKQ